MFRTTLYLDEETVLALRQLAKLQKRTQAEIIRDALKRYFEHARLEKRRVLPGLGAYRSGRHDISDKAEELLKQAAKQR
ncbi:MAG: ribbon-helix-helix protein, CopG family [Methylohalobius sp.]|nr:ribbon-helix-helix protein, CopG family [Methylohalobius sp.]